MGLRSIEGMRAAGGIVALVAAHGTACVHVSRRTVVSEDVLARTEVVGDEVDVRWTGSVRPGDLAFEIRVAGERTCQRLSEQKVVRRTTIERSPDGLMLGTSIVGGLVFGALGAAFVYDHREGTDVEPVLYRGDLDVGRGTGIALIATGALALSGAVIAGVRSRDEARGDAAPIVRRAAIKGTVACGAAPASGVQITLVRGELAMPAGTTDGSGQLAIPYAALPDALVAQPEPAAVRVTATRGKHTFVVGDVPLTLPRQVRLAGAWREAEAGGDPERFERFAQLDPGRAVEALARARTLRTERVTAKLAARDATAAAADLEALRQRHAQGADVDALTRKLEVLRSELQAEERARQRESVLSALSTAVAAVQGGGASADAFQAARTQLEQARAAYADESRVSELAVAFETARSARLKALLADSQRQLRASAFDLARRAAKDAELIAPGDPSAQRAVKAVDDRELTAIEREARKAIAAGRPDDAAQAIDRGVAIRPDDPRMIRLIADVRTSAKRARDDAQAAKLRARTAAIRAELAAARSATRAAKFEAARRRIDEGRRAHGDDPQWSAELARVDKAELDAELRLAEKAVSRKRLEEAKVHVDRAFALGPEDPRLVRLVNKIRMLSKERRP